MNIIMDVSELIAKIEHSFDEMTLTLYAINFSLRMRDNNGQTNITIFHQPEIILNKDVKNGLINLDRIFAELLEYIELKQLPIYLIALNAYMPNVLFDLAFDNNPNKISKDAVRVVTTIKNIECYLQILRKLD